MIAAVKQYLTQQLVGAGVPAERIAEVQREGRHARPVPFADLVTEPERLERDGTRTSRSYDPGTQQADTVQRLYKRELVVRVTLAHRGEAELGQLVDTLLAGLGRGFTDAGPPQQFIRVLPDRANWADDPALLRNRAEVELRIVFRGGLYSSDTAGTIQQVNMPTVTVS